MKQQQQQRPSAVDQDGLGENGRHVNGGLVGGSNGEDSPEDFKDFKNFDTNIGLFMF
jgi:hypothetical protein